jgi:hypothetical protein
VYIYVRFITYWQFSAGEGIIRIDVKALLRIAVVWNIPVACDRASAGFMLSSTLMSAPYERLVPAYAGYTERVVAGAELVPAPLLVSAVPLTPGSAS